MRTRPGLAWTAGISAAALALTACGDNGNGGNGGADGEEEVTLTFTWWGGDVRHQYTQEIIELFEAEYPHITVEPQYGEWDGYWDQLATQTAAQDTPDIIQKDLVYLAEYIQNGILLELDTDIIDTSEFPDELIDTGVYEDALYAMPVGSTVLAYGTNPALLEEAGVEVPDDESWTWDDLLQISAEVSENTDAYGLGGTFPSTEFEIWLRQNAGVDIVTEDGELPWSPEDAADYFDHLGEFRDAGAYPSAAEISEERGIAREQTLLATGGAAMLPSWDTMLVALSSNDGVDLEPLMPPSNTGNAEDAELFYKASMFYSVYAGTEHPEEAQLFVDFLVNDPEAGELQQIERGIPGNESFREAIRDDLDEVETRILDYSERVEEFVGDAPPLQPEGFGAVQDIVIRYEDEFFHGNMDAEEAAEGMHREIEEAIG
ncbi:ABC transporter substrate-binding protein [Nesterenkonia alba]|uniref:ABC transporter substrate-binding protein n=1 Tax=Nesterenkonia alba TaxID=515814 RepID=UPI0003B63B85|nr:extracellular solute-binding protein [Nesterenkonia alba]